MNSALSVKSISLTFAALYLVCAPLQVSAQSKQGIDFYSTGQFKEAEAAFREAQKRNPSDTPNNYYLGLSILLQDRFGEALDVLTKVKQSQDKSDSRTRSAVPDEFQISLALARVQLGLQRYDAAWKSLESASAVNANSSEVFVYRGAYYFQQEKYGDALKELDKAISLDPKNPYAYYYQGLAYYKSGIADKAVSALKMFLQLSPNAPEADEAKEIVNKLC
jgi:tetratricopeptide (TPR) repeat protein